MPLTHVCVWDPTIGYRRITAEEADSLYPYGVSARSGHFVCELCAQNVLFTAPGMNVRHFRHDPSSPNKECDERQESFDPTYGRSSIRSMNSHTMPLRLVYMNGVFELQLGFFYPPVKHARCDSIWISCDAGKYKYSFDRIERDKTTYLSVGSIPCTNYEIEYDNPDPQLLRFWSKKVTGVSPNGSFFDARSGKILQLGGKAFANNDYYLLRRSPLSRYQTPIDIEATELARSRGRSYTTWYLYQIRVKRFSEFSAKFFLRYSIFLTEKPTSFYPVWPAYVQAPYCLYHNATDLYYYLCGDDAELRSFPSTTNVYSTNEGRLYKLSTRLREQLVSLGKSGALGFSYLVRQPLKKTARFPSIIITDNNGTPLTEESYSKIPKLKLISVDSQYDGKAVIKRNGRIIYIYKINGNQTLMIDGLSPGTEIEFFQGCDFARKICFEKKSKTYDSLPDILLVKKLNACTGPTVPISHAIGNLAAELKGYPLTRQWLFKAQKSGNIPRAALNLLRKQKLDR